MKGRFNTIDLVAVVSELKDVVGMRLSQVYDIDHKTYLFKLARQEEKCTLLVESGIRIHTTDYEWPKNPAPHGFTMKLRKHLKNKRLEKISQLGIDRIIDMQFGINEATYHVIVELYDKGNIVLTDCDYTILNILRPRTSGNEDVRLVVRETYPKELARQVQMCANDEKLGDILKDAKAGDNLKRLLNPHFIYGPSLIEHILLSVGLAPNCKIGKEFDLSLDLPKLQLAIENGEEIMKSVACSHNSGYIIQKTEKLKCLGKDEKNDIPTFLEFHPLLFLQHINATYKEFPSFNKAVDCFFSNLEGQKIDIKTFQKEKEAMKKLENIRKDHENRINTLQKVQTADQIKAQFIEMNLQLVDNAILVIRHAIANQLGWTDIWNLVQEAQKQGDPTAKAISALKLDTNHFTMLLYDPYSINDDSNDTNDQELKICKVDIDLDLSAYANARKYYDQKRQAAKKEQKTIESSTKAYKSAEKKAKQTLKEVAITSTIIKARKTFWFEKFIWFISSENYIVIAGRDIQQNELIVKRYMKSGDLYVHADLHGASSVVIKNPSGNPVPPKTLNEAGTMAVCYSTAWDAKVVTSAWWVYNHQVSKTAPTGEYLVAGSFMIRGKKNYLLPSYLIVGFGFLFKLDEDSIERHSEERKIKGDEDQDHLIDTELNENILSSEKGTDEESDSSTEMTETTPSNDYIDVNNEKATSTVTKEDETQEASESSEDEISHFPDTMIKVPNFQMEGTKDNVCDGVVYLGDDKPVVLNATSKSDCKENGTRTSKSRCLTETSIKENEKHELQFQQKRGHKSKLKKIKEKYKNQDEEERELRMKILASAGNKSSNADGKGKKDKKNKVVREKQNQKSKQLQDLKKNLTINKAVIVNDSQLGSDTQQSSHKVQNIVVEQVEKSDDEANDADDMRQNEDEAILSSLTGCPQQEDTLLFAVPVCAPYSAMQNYKYKVKIIPGTGKRGKASKTALNIFLGDKNITSREKDLLRSTKEQDTCRNIPGKVKLSVPGINKKK